MGDSGLGSGLAAKGRPEKPRFRREDDWANLRCTHCGGTRHTKEGCFKIIGYPDWWADRKKEGEGRQKNSGKAAYAGETTRGDEDEGVVANAQGSGLESSELKKEGFSNG